MNFHRLGTVVVCVDMNRLIRSSTSSVLPSEETQYVLMDNGTEFYHSDGIGSEQLKDITRRLRSDYGVVTVDSNRYFAVQGTIKNTSWEYICLVPYDHIFAALSFTMVLALAIILISVLIAILLSRMLIRSVTEDFRRLVNKMKAFGKDESKAPDIGYDYSGRIDEIGVLHNQFDQMTIKIQDLIQQNYVNEILSKDARLKALENQINPHFLYNTLEAVNWRAKAIGEKNISSMVESLGTLLRETLSSGSKNFTLSHELEIVQCYLTIQRIRFEDRLTYSQNVDPAILSVTLPHFTIQPLVENSVNYAMEKSTEVCHIWLEGSRHKDTIVIDVINNGSQFETDLLEKLENGLITPHGFGIGLLNIHKRIQLTYGTGYGLTLFNKDEEHAVARIIIPGGTYAESIDRR